MTNRFADIFLKYPIPEWIKCTDKLPEEFLWVIICKSDKSICFGRRREDSQWNAIGENEFIDDLQWLYNDEVLFWQPLPPPPDA